MIPTDSQGGGPIRIAEEEFETVEENVYNDDNDGNTSTDEIILDTRDPEQTPEGCRPIDPPPQEMHSYNLRPRP